MHVTSDYWSDRRYFRDLMWEYRYKGAGFKSTSDIAENFKAIDMYKEVSTVGDEIYASKVVSMKTTKTTNVNQWKNYQSVQDNILALKQGLISNQGILWNGKTIRYTNPEVHIYMPKNQYSEVLANTWRTTLEDLYPEIKFEIGIMESYIK